MLDKNLSVLNGGLIAIMIMISGELSKIVGVYWSSFIYYAVGCILLFIIGMHRQKSKGVFRKVKGFNILMPGTIGICVILLNNMSINHIGVSLTLALSALGQMTMANITQHYGWFGSKQISFMGKKSWGYGCMLLGILVMILY